MERFILSLATVALVVAGTSTAAWARGPSSGPSHSSSHYSSHPSSNTYSSHPSSNYSTHSTSSQRNFSNQGRNFSSHFYSRNYRGWSSYCWFPGYGCYGYYCPTQCCWYYYSGGQNCYLPVSYMSTFAPTRVNTNQNTNVNTNVNVNGNNSPGLPVGAAPVGAAPVPGGPGLQLAGAP